MRIIAPLVIVATALASPGCAETQPGSTCGDAWYRGIEDKVPTGDGQGHGPDPGSDEWRSVVEFKLGMRGQPGIPDRATDEWCRYIDQYLAETP